jgi:hypothetical protein
MVCLMKLKLFVIERIVSSGTIIMEKLERQQKELVPA